MSLAALTGHPRPYGVRAIHTAQMTAVELARVWADHYGYTGRSGGWIYDQRDRPVVQGWRTFTKDLQRQGFIIPGVGVDWAWTERVWPSLRPARVEPYLLARAADLLAELCEIRYVDRDGHEGGLGAHPAGAGAVPQRRRSPPRPPGGEGCGRDADGAAEDAGHRLLSGLAPGV